jgi:hypothetical protein
MRHYVCVGDCGVESNRSGTCREESCSSFGEPLEECDCEDGAHTEVLAARDLEDEAEEEDEFGEGTGEKAKAEDADSDAEAEEGGGRARW